MDKVKCSKKESQDEDKRVNMQPVKIKSMIN